MAHERRTGRAGARDIATQAPQYPPRFTSLGPHELCLAEFILSGAPSGG
eukprot:CAMPEP_0176030150 /NCGR_PEP_ID=MMETSP0120_2-20121206/14826_1 /TAXON_ID=160619 /ORGANISM="Kryptoperidinium foliaceum, Strain CCMP 1326" /LENGTH=48 /DNA_ID= /DNA_START= /DNA_END= /DNA_ORIENTATION=